MFLVFGPNVASGHSSNIFVEETAIQYCKKMIKPILEGRITSIDVQAAASDKYNAGIQNSLKGTVWNGCSSYYNQDGGKNVGTLTSKNFIGSNRC